MIHSNKQMNLYLQESIVIFGQPNSLQSLSFHDCNRVEVASRQSLAPQTSANACRTYSRSSVFPIGTEYDSLLATVARGTTDIATWKLDTTSFVFVNRKVPHAGRPDNRYVPVIDSLSAASSCSNLISQAGPPGVRNSSISFVGINRPPRKEQFALRYGMKTAYSHNDGRSGFFLTLFASSDTMVPKYPNDSEGSSDSKNATTICPGSSGLNLAFFGVTDTVQNTPA